MTPQAARTAVHAIYAELTGRPVQRTCTGLAGCCHFKLTGRTPYLTCGEALVAAAAWRAAGRTTVPDSPTGACPMLAPDGRCRIYAGRPFGCRTHFCAAAGGPYPRAAVRDLINRLDEIDHHLGGSGAVNLPTALANAMNPPAKSRNQRISRR